MSEEPSLGFGLPELVLLKNGCSTFTANGHNDLCGPNRGRHVSESQLVLHCSIVFVSVRLLNKYGPYFDYLKYFTDKVKLVVR